MYPRPISSAPRQRGFLLPLVLFLLIGAAALALSVSRGSGTVPLLAMQEVYSEQAYYAADSGANYALSRLLLHAEPKRGDADGYCRDLNGVRLSFTAVGLKGCSANLSCQQQPSASNDASYYNIQSRGQCGEHPYDGSRALAVSAYLPGEP